MIREANESDFASIAEIYNHSIMHTTISFETAPVTAEEMGNRVEAKQDAGFPWLVYESEKTVYGYAYAGSWNSRCAYRSSVESSIYLRHDAMRQGIGTRLYSDLLERLKTLGMHTVIGGIALPNPGSIRLHQKLGFEKVAHYRQVGFKFDQWIDVGYWQLLFDSVDKR